MRQNKITRAKNPFSRRGFLQASLLVSSMGRSPQLFERKVLAAEKASPPPKHPLEPLSSAELEDAVRILTRDKNLSESVRFVSITLLEPPKPVVVGYRPGVSFQRRAFAVLLDRAKKVGYEAVVDLVDQAVARFAPLPSGVQPPIMLDEFGECEEAVKRSPEFQAALNKRGVTSVDLVMVEPWSAGIYGTEAAGGQGPAPVAGPVLGPLRAEGQRLRPAARRRRRRRRSNKMEVLRIEDYGVVPLPPETGNWAREYIPEVRKRPQAAGDRPARGPQLHRRGPRGPLAELALPHRLHAARGAGAAHDQL